MDLSPYRQVTD